MGMPRGTTPPNPGQSLLAASRALAHPRAVLNNFTIVGLG